MSELRKVYEFYKLKEVDRITTVNSRKESSAEHSWSCLVLADYFLTKYDLKVDRQKVFDLLLYHDLVEIETGDTPAHELNKRQEIKGYEKSASRMLADNLPLVLKEKYLELSKEYNGRKTQESKFASAINQLDGMMQAIYNKDIWKKYKWDEALTRKIKEKNFVEFPQLREFFESIMKHLVDGDYLL